MLYHERGQAPGHPGGLLSCLGWNLLLTAASSCLSEPRLGQAGKQRHRPGGRTPSLERQHHQHALACERRRRGWVWMSTSSSDSVESQSRFPDVLWTQPNNSLQLQHHGNISHASQARSLIFEDEQLDPHYLAACRACGQHGKHRHTSKKTIYWSHAGNPVLL